MFCTVSTEGLSKAMAERLKYPGRTEAQIVNTSAYYVSDKTMRTTPAVPIGRINTELGVTVLKQVYRMRLSKKTGAYRRTRVQNYSLSAMGRLYPELLAKLIVIARANLSAQGRLTGQSNYNLTTNDRYALTADDLKGGKAVMDEFMRSMTARRRSSPKFLASGWGPAVAAFGRALHKAGPGRDSGYRTGEEPRGSGVPAVEGDWNAVAIIENATGLLGKNAANFNQALMRYGIAPLQQAIAEEESSMRHRIEVEMDKLTFRFNKMAT